ncbi:hypothetical protein Taro_055072 [Colocasia esculenta]|uniref:Uncharacterized protein n=1 Tax=Colocasia esculenta TaxID=4460 RepID=A0A843XQC8_COLES|nr:hypothetical protein [Colocasia esculenta]
MLKPKPTPGPKGEFENACRRSDKGMLPKPLKERLDEGRGMRRGKENAFGDRDVDLRPRMAYGDSSLPSGFACPFLINKEFRLGPGKRWQQQKGRGPCSCCARPLSSRFGIYYKRENPLQITTPLLGSSRVELREQPSDGKQLSRSVQRALFSLRIPRSLLCEFPSGELTTFWALSIPSLEPRRKPPSPTPYLF